MNNRAIAIPICDSHCHLQDERITPHLESVMHNALCADIAGFVCCGSEESDWNAVKTLSGKYTSITPCFGLHPWYTGRRSTAWLSTLQMILENTPGSGVGETGLDHALPQRNDEDQLLVFRKQLELARELGRPASIHCRKAWAVMLDTLRHYGPFSHGLVFHSFSGSSELVSELVRLGGYISFSGSITYSGNRRGRKALTAVPMDRLLAETDTPDLHPNIQPRLTDQSGKAVNEPANITCIISCISEITGQPAEALKRQLWANSVKVFKLSPLGAVDN